MSLLSDWMVCHPYTGLRTRLCNLDRLLIPYLIECCLFSTESVSSCLGSGLSNTKRIVEGHKCKKFRQALKKEELEHHKTNFLKRLTRAGKDPQNINQNLMTERLYSHLLRSVFDVRRRSPKKLAAARRQKRLKRKALQLASRTAPRQEELQADEVIRSSLQPEVKQEHLSNNSLQPQLPQNNLHEAQNTNSVKVQELSSQQILKFQESDRLERPQPEQMQDNTQEPLQSPVLHCFKGWFDYPWQWVWIWQTHKFINDQDYDSRLQTRRNI